MKKLLLLSLIAIGCSATNTKTVDECRINGYVIESQFATTELPVKVLASECKLPNTITINFSELVKRIQSTPPPAGVRYGMTIETDGVMYSALSIGSEFNDLY